MVYIHVYININVFSIIPNTELSIAISREVNILRTETRRDTATCAHSMFTRYTVY